MAKTGKPRSRDSQYGSAARWTSACKFSQLFRTRRFRIFLARRKLAMRSRLILGQTVVLFCIIMITELRAQVSTSVTYEYAKIAYPGAALTTVNGLNNSNTIVGSYFDSNDFVHGFVYRQGKFTAVDFAGATATEVLGINDDGDIVGVYQLPGGLNFHGFLRRNGAFTTIDFPRAQFGTTAFAINRAGTIIGSYDDAHGFTYSAGKYRTLDAPQPKGEPPNTQLNGINNLGWIAGQVLTGGNWRGFWIVGKDLDFLEPRGRADNQVTGINGRGDIVGCHNATAGFISFRVEKSEVSETSEKHPVQEPLASCVTAINFARVVVGNYFTIKQPYGFLGVPALTLQVTSPANHSVHTNPVRIVASASGTNPMAQIQIWANFKKIFQVKGGKLDAKVRLPIGANVRLAIYAVDFKGATTRIVDTVAVY
jgi:uncharacterized membrane protein